MYNRARTTVVIAILAAQYGCTPDKGSVVSVGEPNDVEIVARGLKFDAPTEIPAGWTTFHFKNESQMTHFALIQKLPQGIGLADQQEQVAPVFQNGMNLLNEAKADEAMQVFGTLPAWFGEIVFMGGPGFVSAGGVATTTLNLQPGNYLLECYVKTGGIFHSFNPSPDSIGMVAEFEVTGDSTAANPPEATFTVTISKAGGIEFDGAPTPGKHIVEVQFGEQQTHENFVKHDLHLVRLAPDTDLEVLQTWMDWREMTGLETPAPATFVGGTNEMPAGSTAYLHLDFEPGEYAWIAEVPESASKGMMKKFLVGASAH